MKLNQHGMAACPKCLSEGGPVVVEQQPALQLPFSPGCLDCHLSGPWFETLAEARAWWNDRPSPLIPVEKGQPPIGMRVLGYRPGMGFLIDYRGAFDWRGHGLHPTPSHWMPLPDEPSP